MRKRVTGTEIRIKNTPLGMLPAGVFGLQVSIKPLVDTRNEVFDWAADLLKINQPVALFLTVAKW